MATIPTIREAIEIIIRIEDACPTLTTSQILDTLRYYAGYDTKRFKEFLGTDKKTTYSLRPSGKLTQGDIDKLPLMLKHFADNTKSAEVAEVGIVSDLSGKKLAFGHTICGISGAMHHPKFFYCQVEVKNRKKQIICEDSPHGAYREAIHLDAVAAMTITGDIGQAGATSEVKNAKGEKEIFYLCSKDLSRSHVGGKWKFGGIGSFASQAELIGDMDGFLIGNWLCTDKKVANKTGERTYRSRMLDEKQPSASVLKLSTILSQYYELEKTEIFAGSGYRLASTQRFPSFKKTFQVLNDNTQDPDFFQNQSLIFGDIYAGFFHVPGTGKRNEISDAYTDFKIWLDNNGIYDFYAHPRASSDYDESDEVAWANTEDIEDLSYEFTLTRIDQETGEEEEIACLLFNKIEGTILSEPDDATIAFLADIEDMRA